MQSKLVLAARLVATATNDSRQTYEWAGVSDTQLVLSCCELDANAIVRVHKII